MYKPQEVTQQEAMWIIPESVKLAIKTPAY